MQIILKILGAVWTVYGVIICALSNLNLGVILTLFWGVFFLLWGIFYHKINESCTRSKVLKFFRAIVVSLICAELIFVLFIGVYGQVDNVSYDEDAVVVLGAGIHGDQVTLPLKLRLDKAIEYHRKNPEAIIVVTGGQGFQESVTEASAMEKYLINNGLEQDVIIKEESATSTNENMRFSKDILDTYFEEDYKIVVITNNFHIYRSTQIANSEGFDNVRHLHAGLQWYNMVPCYLRESLAILKMWVLG